MVEFQASSLLSYPTYLEADASMAYQAISAADVSSAVDPSSPGIPFGDTNATFLNMDDVSALTSAHYSGLPETNNISNFSSADLESLFQHIFDDNNFDSNNDNLEERGFEFGELGYLQLRMNLVLISEIFTISLCVALAYV